MTDHSQHVLSGPAARPRHLCWFDAGKFLPVVIVLLTSGSAVRAQDETISNRGGFGIQPASNSSEGLRGETPQSSNYSDRLTGDWGGWRTKLHDWGVEFRSQYISETAGNPVGGRKQSQRYTQEYNLGIKFDLEKLIDLDGGQVIFNLTRRDGADLKPVIGSLRSPQEKYGAGMTTRLTELSYVQKLFNDHLELEIGYEPVGNDFATSKIFCVFQSGMYCGHNPALSSNSNGWYNYPTGQWGANIKFIEGDFYTQFGAYQANPELGDAGHGFDLGFSGTGALVPVEFGWVPDKGLLDLPGKYKVGFYYDTSDAMDVLRDAYGRNAGLTGLDRRTVNGRYGGWIQGEQMIHRTPGYDDRKHGLTLFATLVLGDKATATYDYAVTGGFAQAGTFEGRPDDVFGFAIGTVHVNGNTALFQRGQNFVDPGSVRVQTNEIVYEVDYQYQATPWLQLRPNLQYIQHVGGTGQYPNALVFGLTTSINF
jgi:porin